jgi:formate hydrogenlyase transcriptional activator
MRVDVRLIAATNRDLAVHSRNGRFRLDLYYRLNVFPIDLPPLRARREDIGILAEHFMESMGRKLGKPLRRIAPDTLERLTAHDWPGNIRDLQNTIERAAILASSDVLSVDWELAPPPPAAGADVAPGRGLATAVAPVAADSELLPLEALERSHIITILRRTRGVVDGPKGAARLLALKPSTTRFRMKKLGITKTDYLDPG